LAVASDSSMGPTSDGRFKPEIYAPGASVVSADAADLSGSTSKWGTSMATPHVVGVAATLLDHHANFVRRPAMLKAYLIASAERISSISDARAGLVDAYNAHWSSSDSSGHWGWHDSSLSQGAEASWDINVADGWDKMYVALTWIEPAPSAGASATVYNDIDLRVDHGANGSTDWSSSSANDNYEFVEITDPPAGDYRFKAYGFSISQSSRLGLGVFLRNLESPVLEYFSHRIDDDMSVSDGNDDGMVNPGESIELPVTLRNVGSADARNVSATLSTTDAYITITDNIQSWGTIAAGATDESIDYDFDVAADCPPGRVVTFTLSITSDEGSWTDTFTITVVGTPEVSYHSHRIDDDMSVSSGNDDGLVHPGETIELPVTLQNTGGGDAHSVSA
ncbi:MAG: S8 family serine peptidase, partial [Verrucomicrobiota bacterium]